MNKSHDLFLKGLQYDQHQIDINRKDDLNLLAEIIHAEIEEKDSCQIIFICTHNSRRSQLIQFLMCLISSHFNLSGIEAYSGGIEVTAFNHRMVAALKAKGFVFSKSNQSYNPEYRWNGDAHTQPMFSKIYDHSLNPSKNFMAVMVCDHADENCPIVTGAKHRISLPYLDPKAFDDTPEETEAYANKILEIGREIWYLCEKIREHIESE